MSGIPANVRRLLYQHIATLEELELLVLLVRHPDRSWTVDDAESTLKISASDLSAALRSLHKSGFCERVDGAGEQAFQLVRRDPLARVSALELVSAYDADRIAVIKLVSEAAMERVRGSMEKAFADAFLLGGRKKRDG